MIFFYFKSVPYYLFKFIFSRLMYETDSFFETIAEKNYGEVNNFLVSPWSDDFEASSRSMHYEFQQAFAFSKV